VNADIQAAMYELRSCKHGFFLVLEQQTFSEVTSVCKKSGFWTTHKTCNEMLFMLAMAVIVVGTGDDTEMLW